MLYIVVREPKGRFIASHRCSVVVVDAKSNAAAVRQATKIPGFMGGEPRTYSAPSASELKPNEPIYI